MPRFLIEVPHGQNTIDCARAVEIFLRTGSHFLTHADWGCKDGDHRAWIVLEVDNREEARNVIPPVFQAQAKIVQLNAFTLKEIEGLLRQHGS
jgi:hypothetical protein